MAEKNVFDKFDPNGHEHVCQAFDDFMLSFDYTYESIAKDPPSTVTGDDAVKAWTEQNKRKVFLGKFASRNLQKEYEEITTETERATMTFKTMKEKFQQRFQLSNNSTLANYKFRQLTQESDESFDQFVIRTKKESQGCAFKCASTTCTVKDTLVRDQIILGTKDDDIRRTALHEQWDLTTLVAKGRSLEAATAGADKIKTEMNLDNNVARLKPKRYSRKFDRKSRSGNGSAKVKCDTCSNPRCKGDKSCPGKTITCHDCDKKGHYKGARACEKNKKPARRAKKKAKSDSDSSSDSDTDASDSSDAKTRRVTHDSLTKGTDASNLNANQSSDSDTGSEPVARQARRRQLICRIKGGVRKAEKKKSRSPKSRYEMQVVINGHKTEAYADTGADLCVMSLKTAKRLKLPLSKTKMQIRPYGSKAKPCKGLYVGTVMYEDQVTNAKFYILNDNVETLLSGKVCEDLGIIKLNESHIRRVGQADTQKEGLLKAFPKLFEGIGLLKNFRAKYHIDETVKPVAEPQRPVPFHLRSKWKDAIDKLEAQDLIEPHSGPSPWVSNMYLAPKDDGSLRATLDMRKPNTAIKRCETPIVRPEEVKAELLQYKVFSKLDFKSAFHQIELDEESRLMTVFNAGNRLLRFKRLVMGSTPATGILAEALRPIFSDQENVHVIQDDVIVGGKDKKEHDRALWRLCKSIQESGMTLNLDKCIIGKTQIPWWGMIITDEGMKPDPTKIAALRAITAPKDKDEVRSLICMVQSHKDFIPNLATKTENLRRLLKKHARFVWDNKCKKEFENLKEELCEDTLLRHFDPNQKSFVFADAHRSGLSAVFCQGENMQSALPVAYASRATTDVESRYPQLDLEAMAIDFALRRFRLYFAGGPEVTIITDHKPLEAIFRNSRSGSIRTERIKMRHQDTRFSVVWRDGKSNPADYLSRHATPLSKIPREQKKESAELERTIWFLNYGPYTEAVSMEKIIEATKVDPILQSLAAAVKIGKLPKKESRLKAFSKIFDKLSLSDEGMIMKEERIILPEALIKRALKKAHQGSHPGISGMKRRVRSHFWFPNLNARVEEFVKACQPCTLFTNKHSKDMLQPLDNQGNNDNWKHVHVDLFGPMPDKKHVLVAIDGSSRFPAAKIVPSTAAKPVIQALDEIYTDFGRPDTHRTDNGPPFNSHEFEQFSADNNINHLRNFPYHPQANLAETFMKPLGKTMKIAHHLKADKQKALNDLLTNFRATPHSATDTSPGDMMFREGYSSSIPGGVAPSTETQLRAKHRDQLAKLERARHENASVHRRQAKFKIGDIIYTRQVGGSKFAPIWDPSPRLVLENDHGGVVCLSEDGVVQRRHNDDVRHVESPPVGVDPEINNNATPDEQPQTAESNPDMRVPATDDDRPSLGDGSGSQSSGRSLRPRENIKPPARFRDDEA